ncbi:MAG: DUF1232 domain-containing protein [Rhodanobacter sp.]|nr:MAG: DUF1232 domain-containing protein [Rhodanobacter sp.]TAM13143.1 MAG: DUF1232 domain-containing protein [Rhodanobacter sp.]TAM35144.1 MAG: DUF1232 domain-containing protein [Rhodanobacter sp.]
MSRLRRWARELKRQTLVVYFAARDPRTPRLARLLAFAVAAYALSPIDLIPDFIPVLGYLDDLVIVPLGMLLVLRMLPVEVLASAQAKAAESAERPTCRGVAAMVVLIWLAAAVVSGWWVWHWLRA